MHIPDVTTACTVCRNPALKTVINFGMQPPSNRFVTENSCAYVQETYPLALGYCPECGTTQLTHRMPISAIRPRYDWLLYNEPEKHLDDVATQLSQLPGIDAQSRILGVTYKDQSTIDRLAKLGIPQGVCMGERDFSINLETIGLETIQQLIRDPSTIAKLKEKYGTVDILLMRHIVEHADDAAELVLALRCLIANDGYLVMELPDCEKIFNAGNHAFIWEEHISYFTKQSLQSLAHAVGATLAWFKRCPYAYEDSLVVAFRFQSSVSQSKLASNDICHVEKTLEKFSDAFEIAQQKWRDKLIMHHKKGEKVAVFGAGHLAAKFINFLNLKDLIDCVVDDHPNKVGMRMPGSLLPIVSSKALVERQIRICISTLNPESETKVRQKLASVFDNGCTLIPAFTVTRDLL